MDLRPLCELTKTSPGTGSGQDYVPPPSIKGEQEQFLLRADRMSSERLCSPFAQIVCDWVASKVKYV